MGAAGQKQQVLEPLGQQTYSFGTSVALNSDGSIAIVGDNHAAHLFLQHGNTWTEQQQLQPSDGRPDYYFGTSVVLSGDGSIALLGAVGNNFAKGAVYLFTRRDNTWTEQQQLQAYDGVARDYFGRSVALSSGGDVALIGADGKNSLTGAAYLFTRDGNTWTQLQELISFESGEYYFGASVALNSDGNVALIGVPGTESKKGAADLFIESNNTWTQQQQLHASDGAFGNAFGSAVALTNNGNIAVIGAPGKNKELGAAYVFTEQ